MEASRPEHSRAAEPGSSAEADDTEYGTRRRADDAEHGTRRRADDAEHGTRRRAAWGLAALLGAMFLGNMDVAIANVEAGDGGDQAQPARSGPQLQRHREAQVARPEAGGRHVPAQLVAQGREPVVGVTTASLATQREQLEQLIKLKPMLSGE